MSKMGSVAFAVLGDKLTFSLAPRKPRPEGTTVSPTVAQTILVRYDLGHHAIQGRATAARAQDGTRSAIVEGL